jgi:hypothetical protein
MNSCFRTRELEIKTNKFFVSFTLVVSTFPPIFGIFFNAFVLQLCLLRVTVLIIMITLSCQIKTKTTKAGNFEFRDDELEKTNLVFNCESTN